MKQTRSRAEERKVKRGNPKAAKSVRKTESASRRATTKQVWEAKSEVIERVYQLQKWAYEEVDSRVAWEAFEALSRLLHDLLAWLEVMALLSLASLGALSRRMPEQEAREKYERGEHAGAWAGVELARLYKRIKMQLASRSKNFSNLLHDLLYGPKFAGGSDWPPNDWFRREYESKRDYRPTGRMALWIARKIEEIRRVKPYARIKIAAHLRSQPETVDMSTAWFRPPEVVQSDRALKKLDDLPPFGDPAPAAVNAWRSFVRYQILTQTQIITEFESLFPNQRKKLDGVITATLRLAWRAAQGGGYVILPEQW